MATQANQPTIRRGTTPNIVINVHNRDISGEYVELLFDNNGYQIVHTTNDRLSVVTEEAPSDDPVVEGEEPVMVTKCKLHTRLTQDETLPLKPNSKVSVQFRVGTESDAAGTEIATMAVTDILRNGKLK